MRHKRYHHWMMLCALILGPAAASAQAELTPDGGPVTVAEGEFPVSVEFTVNSAAAIDQDGNVVIGFKSVESGSDPRQIVDAFAPNGETARYEAPAFPLSASETNGVTAMPGNLFAVARHADSGDEFSPDFTVEFLSLSDQPARKTKSSEKILLGNPATQGEVGERLREALREEGCESPTFKDPALIRIFKMGFRQAKYSVVVLCKSQNYEVNFIIEAGRFGSNPEVIDIDIEVDKETPSPTASKNNEAPPASDPVSAIGRRQDIGILAYFGRPPSGEFTSRVTLLELGDNPANQDVIQIDEPQPLGFPEGTLATCGFPDRSHYWVVFVSQAGQAIAARVGDTIQDMMELGPSSGAVDVACGAWGNAVVSWADTSGSARVHTAVLGPGGEMLDSFEQGSLGFAETPDPDDFRVSNDINEAGEIVVTWTDGNGGDEDRIAFRRLKLSGHFTIDGTLSGSHYSPAFSGEGFIFDIVELEGQPTLVVYYFTYNDNGSGDPTWLVGQGPIVDNRAVAEMITGAGATFGDDFDPENVTRKAAGTVTATFLSCGLVLVEADSNRFGQQAYIAGPLTGRPLEVDGQCGTGPDGTAQVDASRGGSLYTPSRSGEGFIFDIVRVNGVPTLVAYYFTYQPDGSGNPAWMVGQGPIEGDSATLTMTIAEGASFGPDFDPADVVRTEWGEITVTFQTCENVLVEYDGLWGEGSFNVGPLTPPLIGATGLCAEPIR